MKKYHSKTFKTSLLIGWMPLKIFTALWISYRQMFIKHTPSLQREVTHVHAYLIDSPSYSGSIVWLWAASVLLWFRWRCGHRHWSQITFLEYDKWNTFAQNTPSQMNLILKCLYSCKVIKTEVILWYTLSIWFHSYAPILKSLTNPDELQ